MMYCSIDFEFLSKGTHFERVIEFLILTQTNGLNYSLQEDDPNSQEESKNTTKGLHTSAYSQRQGNTGGNGHEIFEFIKEIKSECKVALLLIENYNTITSKDFTLSQDTVIKNEIIKIDFLMKSVFKNSEHLTCKSLACLEKMLNVLTNKRNHVVEDVSEDEFENSGKVIKKPSKGGDQTNLNKSMRKYLLDGKNFVRSIEKLLDSPHPCVVREAARVLSSFVSRPEGMELWLKFDSARVGIDSACVRDVKVYGNPTRIPKDTGYHLPIKETSTFRYIIEEKKARTEQLRKRGIGQDFMNKDTETKAGKGCKGDKLCRSIL
ncbi:unnamed protein product [Moneuplotes crassus]|uniref:Uncharacterized protein n=1 Tax=Euplotes crassus TaxID=5936 RepID=A0AAD2D245_EUPCR|nr:unnamed protein product [Moneuplotes crassus]